jgi:23S rRNA (pseudouridine1915-N3)-methyltransferase
MKIQIIAAGQLKQGPERALFEEYAKRLSYPLKLVEIAIRQDREIPPSSYLKAIAKDDLVILLDETGENLSSREFAKKLTTLSETGKRLCFIIGGADGIPAEVKNLSCFSISFGKLTWPHLLVRALLVEQLYRSQQININHPYHRD